MTVKRCNTGSKVGFTIPTKDPEISLVKTTDGIEEFLTSDLIIFSGYMSDYELSEDAVNKMFNLKN
jgi:hypothetical protein